MRGQLCRLWANGRAELPVTMQQRAAWMHAGVWSSAAAQLPLSLPRSHQEAEQKYESMGSTWGESYGCSSEPAAPSTTSCTSSQVHSCKLWTFWRRTPRKWAKEGFKHLIWDYLFRARINLLQIRKKKNNTSNCGGSDNKYLQPWSLEFQT